MENLIDFLAKKEVLIILSVLCLLFLFWVILLIQHSYVKLKEKSKLKQNTQELKNLVQEVREEASKHPVAVVATPTSQEEVPQKVPTSLEEALQTITPQVVLPTEIAETTKAKESSKEDSSVLQTSEQKKVESAPVLKEEIQPNTSSIEKQTEKKEEAIQASPLKDSKKEEEIVYKDEVYTKTEAQEELARLTKELEKEEQEVSRIELTEFEAKQEENAIISLEELFKKGKSLVEANEETQYMDEGNEPISLKDLQEKMKKQEEVVTVTPSKEEKPKVEMMDMETASVKPIQEAYSVKADKKYTPSPVISPVFGLKEEGKVHDESLELEDTANFEKLDEEIRKTNEFLAILKELQKKLD